MRSKADETFVLVETLSAVVRLFGRFAYVRHTTYVLKTLANATHTLVDAA